MRHNLGKVPVDDLGYGCGWHLAFVQLENCHEKREFNIVLLGTGSLHLRQNFERLLLGFLVVIEILFARRSHRYKGCSIVGLVKPLRNQRM